MYKDFSLTGSMDLWNRSYTVSMISLVVSTAYLSYFNSLISAGLIELTAASAFLKYGIAA